MQPHFFTALPRLWIELKSHTFAVSYRTLNEIYSKSHVFYKNNFWLETDSDIILNKPDFNRR